LTKNGGTIASQGAVTRLFHRKGQMILPREAAPEDQLMELALEAGAEDFIADEHGYEIITDPSSFEAVHKQVEGKGLKPAVAEVAYVPTMTVRLEDPAVAAAVRKLIDVLEDHDDVKAVHSNAEFADESAGS
jgi:transcriptional/translational regulatory protein YebC/TACO1